MAVTIGFENRNLWFSKIETIGLRNIYEQR